MVRCHLPMSVSSSAATRSAPANTSPLQQTDCEASKHSANASILQHTGHEVCGPPRHFAPTIDRLGDINRFCGINRAVCPRKHLSPTPR